MEEGVGGNNQVVVEEANEEGRMAWEDVRRCQSAVQSQRWAGVKMRGLLFVKAWQPEMRMVRILRRLIADAWSLLLWRLSPPPHPKSPCLPLRNEGRPAGKKVYGLRKQTSVEATSKVEYVTTKISCS